MNVLPFLPEFREKVRDGRKTATARSKPYGKEGDKVQGPGVVLVLEYVARWPLGTIASECFEIEGLESKEAFIEVWNRIHPTKRYDPSTMVGGRTIAIDQGAYGHRAKKRTWLYGVLPVYPALRQDDSRPDAVPVEHMGKLERRLTPPAFADLLVELARSCIGWRPSPPARQLTLAIEDGGKPNA